VTTVLLVLVVVVGQLHLDFFLVAFVSLRLQYPLKFVTTTIGTGRAEWMGRVRLVGIVSSCCQPFRFLFVVSCCSASSWVRPELLQIVPTRYESTRAATNRPELAVPAIQLNIHAFLPSGTQSCAA
jgi:hypothetical protein